MQGSFTGWLMVAMGLAFLIPGFILTVRAYTDNDKKIKTLGVRILLIGAFLALVGILVVSYTVGQR